MTDTRDKIKDGLKDAIRFAQGEDVGARVTQYGNMKTTAHFLSQDLAAHIEILSVRKRQLDELIRVYEQLKVCPTCGSPRSR